VDRYYFVDARGDGIDVLSIGVRVGGLRAHGWSGVKVWFFFGLTGPDVGFARLMGEAVGHAEVAVLGAGDFDVAIADEVLGHGLEGAIVGGHGVVHGYGEEAGFQAGGAEDGLLS
jgi:hypothetical protein